LTDKQFDLSRYRDGYMDGLSALIERRLAEVGSSAVTAVDGVSEQNDPDEAALVAALRASLAAAGVDSTASRLPQRSLRAAVARDEPPAQKLA
jgi:non-homologous end joining protein Ku